MVLVDGLRACSFNSLNAYLLYFVRKSDFRQRWLLLIRDKIN